MEKGNLNSRIQKIFKNAKGAATILIANTSTQDPNFLYLTGFNSGLYEGSVILLTRNSATLLTSVLEAEDAERHKPKGLKVVKVDSAAVSKKIMEKGLRRRVVGVNGDFLTYSMYNRIRKRYKPKKITDISDAFSKARLIKDEDEVRKIRAAAKITKKAMQLIQKSFKDGITEKQLADEFDSISARLGSAGPSFKTIVCFGSNASMPHHSPDNTKLKYGDFVLIDAGAKVQNYCSDITRTFIFGSDKSRIKDYKKKMEMYNIVKEAQQKAYLAIRPGKKGSAIHKIAQDIIDKSARGKYKGTFIHSLGHSLGIEVHDGPGLSPGAENKLQEGTVVTVEPGIYVKGFGGVRIEDDVLVTKKEAIML